nr:ABC transporter permease [Eubacterium sp.]
VAGCITGILHVKLKLQPLLSGILVYTLLLTVNLVLIKAGTDGQSIASVFGKDTIFNSGPANLIPDTIGNFDAKKLIVLAIFVLILKILMDLYLKTKSGMLLRATGSNQQYVVMLAKNPGVSKVLGLSLFKRLHFMKATTMVILGTIIYKACLQIAIVIGLPSEYNKALMAILFVLALIFSGTFKDKVKKRREKHA